MAERDPNDLLTPAEASRILGVTPDAVRLLADKGQVPVLRTETGRRIFKRADVERLAASREATRSRDSDGSTKRAT